jgi:hypothetical protein
MTEDDNFKLLPKLIQRRIHNEINEITKQKYNIFVQANHTDKEIILILSKHNSTIQYEIKITENYPFCAPSILVNGKLYSDLLKKNSNSKFIYFLTGHDCLFCNSFMNRYVWTPKIKILDMIDEIQKNIKIKQNIIYKIHIDKIKDKYLIRDIPIEDFVFEAIYRNKFCT